MLITEVAPYGGEIPHLRSGDALETTDKSIRYYFAQIDDVVEWNHRSDFKIAFCAGYAFQLI
jgi:hypothetical protein